MLFILPFYQCIIIANSWALAPFAKRKFHWHICWVEESLPKDFGIWQTFLQGGDLRPVHTRPWKRFNAHSIRIARVHTWMRIASMRIQTGLSQTTSRGGFNPVRGEFRCALIRMPYLSMEGAVSENLRIRFERVVCGRARAFNAHWKNGPNPVQTQCEFNAHSVWTGLQTSMAN